MANTYTLISSNVLGSDTPSLTFSSIPATYTDLVLQASVRGSRSAIWAGVMMQINGNSGVSYSNTYLKGNGATAQSARNTTSSAFDAITSATGNTAFANTFGSLEIYIPNYLIAQNHPLGSFGVQENNTGQPELGVTAGLGRVASAITSLTFIPASGSTNFLTGSSFYLYGIKNS